MNLYTAVDNVLKRLDDFPSLSGEQIWTRAEVELYLKDGYNAFCRQTKCLFDLYYPENVPPAGNYTGWWERDYFDSGMIAVGLLNYSGGYWERDYAEASDIGPVAYTQPWEDVYGYVATTFSAFYPLPQDNVAVDRATYDLHQLSPEWTRWFEQEDRDFPTTQGDPWRFSMDRDGISAFRLVPAGNGAATVAATLGTYGILRLVDTITDDFELYGDSLYCYWKLDEPSGTRYAAVGDYDFSEYTASVSSTTGKVDEAATFDAGADGNYLYTGTIPITGDFTITAWAKVSTDTLYVISGTAPTRITVSAAGVVTVSFWDPTSGNELVAQKDTGISIADSWVFIVARYDQTNHSVDMRFYGFGAYNATTYTATGDVWTNAVTSLTLKLSYTVATGPNWASTAGSIDEVAVFRGLLSDDECNALYASYGAWAGTGAISDWGSLREIPEHFPMGGQWGIPRRRYSDTANTRVEYFRLGKDLDEYAWELPDRFVKYPEFYACARALERDGPGQNMTLAGHFMERFGEGVRRMVLRLGENKRAVVGQVGGTGRTPTKPALARLPWRYGRQIRRGY